MKLRTISYVTLPLGALIRLFLCHQAYHELNHLSDYMEVGIVVL